jgi:hypothetical protein
VSGATTNGTPFDRQRRHIFPVAANSFRLTGTYNDSLKPALNSKTLNPDLVLGVEINALAAGQVGVSADLSDDKGHVVATSNTFGAVEPGDHILNLRFRGRDLLKAARNGPYTLGNVRLVDYSAGGFIVETARPAYTTRAYNVSRFAALAPGPPHEIAVASAGLTPQVHDSAHTCTVTASNNSGLNLSVGDTFQFDFAIDLDSGGKYPEWLDYYYTAGPPAWPMSAQSVAPPNAGGWGQAMTQTFNYPTGLAYWGFDYSKPTDLDLANSVLPQPGTFWGPWRPDTGAPYNFSITYAVPDSLPGCPSSPFVGLPLAGQSVTGAGIGDLIDHSVNAKSCSFGGYVCPLPAVTLELTVSPNNTCPGSTVLSVPGDDQAVTFCYALMNNSSQVTIVNHSLANSLIDDKVLTLSLGPGESFSFSVEVTLNEIQGYCYDNNVTWLAVTDTGFGQAPGDDASGPFITTTYQATSTATATVCVGPTASPEVEVYLPLVVKDE